MKDFVEENIGKFHLSFNLEKNPSIPTTLPKRLWKNYVENEFFTQYADFLHKHGCGGNYFE